MRANSKSTVSLIALFASLSARQSAPKKRLPRTENIVVTGSRVISNIENSPTPLTTLTNTDLEQFTPTSVSDALIKLPVFSGSTFPRQAYQDLTILDLRNFGGTEPLF